MARVPVWIAAKFVTMMVHRYEKEWPLSAGHEERQVVYNVYHILNHHVLFGGMYLSQAQRMMGQILRL